MEAILAVSSNLDWTQPSINCDLLPSHAGVSSKIEEGICTVLEVSLNPPVSFRPYFFGIGVHNIPLSST